MTNTKKAIALLAALLVAGASHAADESNKSSGTSTTIKSEKLKSEKKNDIDNEITNAALRVASGSKDKYSFSSSMAYSGGNLSQPFGDLRPNLKGQEGTEVVTSFGGSISGRYRFNKKTSATLGIGLGLGTPFNTEKLKSNNAATFADRVYVTDPYVSVSYVTKVGGFQMITGSSFAMGTSENSVQFGSEWGLSVSNTLLTQTGRLTWGLSSVVDYTNLGGVGEDILEENKTVRYKKGDVCSGCSALDLGFYPYLEYSLNDDTSLRTVFRWFEYSVSDQSLKDGLKDVEHVRPDQSVGVMYSFTRDFYVYPNIQFNDSFSLDSTNFAITASMNL